MINVVDRIGKTHQTGELVYAYFDTSTETYIVLDKYSEPATPTIYGIYYNTTPPSGYLQVEYAAGIDHCKDYIYKDAMVPVVNKMNLSVNCDYGIGVQAIAIKMEKLK